MVKKEVEVGDRMYTRHDFMTMLAYFLSVVIIIHTAALSLFSYYSVKYYVCVCLEGKALFAS